MRPGTLAVALAIALAIALVLALPAAQAKVTVDSIEVPPRTAALKPFDVNVTLRNDGAARTVYLFGALYDLEEGRGCGAATDPRFRTFTHMVQDPVELPAQSTTRYPAEGGRWLHRYETSNAARAPEDAQLCIFVANASQGPVIDYEAFAPTTLSVRAVNGLPVAEFTWSPERPAATKDVVFSAEASDPDGDPVRYHWDFGRGGGAGTPTAEGSRAATFFYPARGYLVTLTVTDGIDATSVAHEVTVVAEDEPASERPMPLPPLVTLAALLGAAAWLRRTRPPRSR